MRVLKWAVICLGGLLGTVIIAAVLAIAVGATLFDAQSRATVPAGYARDASFYIASRDGTKIAVDVWLPAQLARRQHVPALIKATPYWRGRELSLLGEALAYFVAPDIAMEPDVALLNQRGYAVLAVDARGTGASFGTLKIMFSDAEVNDYASIADWITKQPWSNGKVGAYGFSYRGISAANMASLSNPSIRAVAPLFDLTDLYLVGYPGGAYAKYLMTAWGAQTRELNEGRVPCEGDLLCKLAINGPKPVDSDSHGVLLQQAIAEHAANYNVHACTRAAPARDDVICASHQSISDVSLLARKDKVEARHLPMFVLTGWLDESSPMQAFDRYRTFSNPQQLVIGPFTHGGFEGDDPFAPNGPMALTYREQTELMADFFDRYLKDGPERPIGKSVRYYVIGAGQWHNAASWPPANSVSTKWFLAGGSALAPSQAAPGVDRYKVDFAVSTGALSGYRGQVDLSKTDYGDRANIDKRLLTYTSAPVAADTEIAGNPIAHLRLASSATDGLVIVYLEDVAPAGRVTYVSQGVLRLAHRKLATPGGREISADRFHSYLKADMAPMKPGVAEDITIAISPIAALIKRGHRIRIAIAGADEENLERLPLHGDATLSLERGTGSYLELPLAK
jgi:putative CocE/NonD family hydrolase